MTNPEELEDLERVCDELTAGRFNALDGHKIDKWLRQYLSILPLVSEMIKDKAELFDAADFKHGDDLAKYYTSEVLLIQYAEAAANNTTAIAKILGG